MAESTEFLFVRNDGNSEDDDTWDDRELIKMYDNALQTARSEVAKRLAMETNTKSAKPSKSRKSKDIKKSAINEESQQDDDDDSKSNLNEEWQEGDHCRAIYAADGLEYEAIIATIDAENNTCTVKYIGYNNEEVHLLSNLTQSFGPSARNKQMKDAKETKHHPINKEEFVRNLSSGVSEGSQAVPPKKKSARKQAGLPRLPFSFPPFMPSHENSMMMPPPPPMPFLGRSKNADDDKALHSMLVSWYMTGYYTGLYQGKKEAKAAAMKNKNKS